MPTDTLESQVVVSAIDDKLKGLPKSDVLDRGLVLDVLLDLRKEVQRILDN